MNILVLNWLDRENPSAGGAEVHLHETFGRLARRPEWSVTAVTSGWSGSARHVSLDGIEIHRVGGRHTYLLQAPRYVRSALGDRAFDLVVEDLNKVPLFSPLWAGRPTLLLVHHLFGRTAFSEAGLPVALATWLLERPIPQVYRGAPAVAVSQSTRTDLVDRGLDPDRIEVIENGVDVAYLRPSGLERRFRVPTVLYLGRLKRYKGIELPIRAVDRLRQGGLNVRLLIAGRGDDRVRLERLATRLGLDSDAVRFVGFVDEAEKRELLQRAWVHVLTSAREGWGISNLEAAACGTPTVASDSPGLRDSVHHGRTGLLVPHGHVAALAEAIRELVSSPERLEGMGTAAREFAEGLSWERTTDRIERALGRAVAPGLSSD